MRKKQTNMNKNKAVFPLVLSAPSGGGKTAIREILIKDPRFGFSITCTTRKPRPGETDGKDYYFVSRENFAEMQKSGQLIEWAEVHGNFYGTPVKSVHDVMEAGKIPVMTIDVKGAASVRRIFNNAVTVFIIPPSPAILKKRLELRGESPEGMKVRLQTARAEMKQAHLFDYLVINDKLEDAAADVIKIIEANSLSMSFNKDLTDRFALEL